MISSIWKPLYVEDFDYEQYLYHYTSLEAAIKIISNNSLLFSRISNTNDTSESKMKIIFSQDNIVNKEDYRKKVDTIIDYFNKYHNVVQLLCFSTDAKITKTDRKKYLNSVNSKDMYYDISGRGFALPRMWAQYADNNKGVCFVFNKAKLLNIIKKTVAFYKCDSVKYKKFFNRYLIDSTQMQTIYDKTSMIANGSLTLIDMIQNDKAFLQYNFFEKLDDWKNEHEFRILALIDNKTNSQYRLPIKRVNDYLEGIVIGEKFDSDYEQIINMLISSKKLKCDVKRIKFSESICKLE